MADFEFDFQLDSSSRTSAAVFEFTDNTMAGWEKLIQNLLFSCREPGASLEWLIESSNKHPGHADIYLITRNMEWDHDQAARQMTEQEMDCFAEKLSDRSSVMLAVPGEGARNVQSCYVPGGYELMKGLDLTFIRLMVSEYRDLGFSLQIKTAAFTEEEHDAIYANLEWIGNTFPENTEKLRAIQAYQHYEAMQAEQMFCLCLSVWGQEEGLTRLTEYLMSCGADIMDLPREPFRELNYLSVGAVVLPYLAEVSGHILGQGIALPEGCGRFNYLTTVSELQRFLGGREEGSSLQQDREYSAPDPGMNRMDGKHPGGYLCLGKEKESEKEAYLPIDQLTRHMVIAGMSGSGKTSLLFQVISELHRNQFPVLIIEPVKTEYRGLRKIIPDLKIVTPGRTDVCPVMFNPFLPPKGISLEQFLPSLVSAFQMAFSLTTPLDVILPEVIRNCYVKYNWRNDSTRDSVDVKIFGMHEFICAFNEEIQASSYDPESKQNLNSGGVYRLQSLINSNPYLFDTDRSLDIEELLKTNTLIELDGIDNPEHKTLFLALLLLQLKLVIRKKQKKDSQLKNVILIDEAHVLLDGGQTSVRRNEADPVGKLQNYLLEMVKENRVYGTGMIFADQSLAILREFVNNSNIKIAMHLESAAEREFLTANLNLSSEIYRKIAGLHTGEYFLFYEDLEGFQQICGADARRRLDIPGNVDDDAISANRKDLPEQPFTGCKCKKGCDLAVRNEADFIARRICNSIRSLLNDQEALKEYMRVSLDDAIYDLVETSDTDNDRRLMRCARMMTERMVQTKADALLD